MKERFETFTILIARLSRSVKRIKAEQMADFQLKGPQPLINPWVFRQSHTMQREPI